MLFDNNFLAGVEGIEPPAHGFGDRCSGHLSYTPLYCSHIIANQMAPAQSTQNPSQFDKMASMNLTQPLLLLVVGKPGAGKSFFAQQFSTTFGAPVVSVDRLRHELFAKARYDGEKNDLLTRIIDYQLEELLKTKKTIIIDGCCNAKVERQRFRRRAREAGYETFIIWVQTDDATCRARATKRRARRVEDAYQHILEPGQFEAISKRFTSPAHEAYVVISGRHTYPAQAKTLLRVLAAPHETMANDARQTMAQSARAEPGVRLGRTRRSVIIR